MKRAQIVVAMAVALIGCGGPPPPTQSARPPTEMVTPSITSSPTSVPAPSQLSTVPPAPQLPANAYIDPDGEVVFTGDMAVFTLGATAGSPAVDIPISAATVDFGDGTTAAVDGSCTPGGSPQKVAHIYQSSGHFTARVSSAQLCEPGRGLDFSESRQVLILPSAPSSTRDWPTCTTFQIRMTGTGQGAALGNVGALFRLQNRSSVGCTLDGYPGIRLVSPTGVILHSDVHEAIDGDYLFPAIPSHRVALEPGSFAAFALGYGDNPFGPGENEPYDVACPTARWVRIVLPQTHQFGTASLAISPCEGRMNVSPIFPGADWISFQ